MFLQMLWIACIIKAYQRMEGSDMSAILDGKRMVLGVCYYPEHWPEAMWREDLTRMLDTGIEVVRIAEFAWTITEPEEGVFRYDFFDRFLDLFPVFALKL